MYSQPVRAIGEHEVQFDHGVVVVVGSACASLATTLPRQPPGAAFCNTFPGTTIEHSIGCFHNYLNLIHELVV